MFFYLNKTTTLATVYADEALTIPLPNPLPANSAGQWLPVWADDANLFSVAVEAPYGPPGIPFTFDDLGPSTSSNAGALNKLDRDGGNAEPGVAVNIGAVRVTGDTITGPTEIVGPFQLKALDDGTQPPPVGTYFGTGGNSLKFSTPLSTPSGGADLDHQRAQFLIVGETTDDGNSEEQAQCIIYTIKTGYAPEFQPATAYSVGDNFTVSSANAVYRVTTAGVSGATPPAGKTTGITNGSLVVDWINDAAINAKLASYIEVPVLAGAGSAWGEVLNFDMRSGFNSSFACAREIDLTNHTGFDSAAGSYDRIGLWVACQGPNRSTTGLQVSSANTSNDALIWGAYFAGSRLATNSVIGIDASSAIGIGFGTGAGGVVTPTFTTAVIRDKSISPQGLSLAGTYSIAAINVPDEAVTPSALSVAGVRSAASIYDGATTPSGLVLAGAYSVAAINITGSGPAGVSLSGAKSVAGIIDNSTAPFGLQLNGSYSSRQISGTNFDVDPGGTVTAQGFVFNFLPGDFADDAAAAAGGIVQGGVYRTGNLLKVRVTA